MSLGKRAAAEAFGTFWLVFGGCGAAVFAANFASEVSGVGAPFSIGIGFLGVALAFGLTVLTMAYAIGHISGCHLNPAVTVGLCVGKRFPRSEVGTYILAQVAGAIVAAAVLLLIASGRPAWVLEPNGLAVNGYGPLSPGGYGLLACFIAEVVLTFFFLFVILGATDRRAPAALAPVAIGLCLTLIHLIGIPITNTSVNPARSLGPALFTPGFAALKQVWLFWTAPFIGAALAGWCYPRVAEDAADLVD